MKDKHRLIIVINWFGLEDSNEAMSQIPIYTSRLHNLKSEVNPEFLFAKSGSHRKQQFGLVRLMNLYSET